MTDALTQINRLRDIANTTHSASGYFDWSDARAILAHITSQAERIEALTAEQDEARRQSDFHERQWHLARQALQKAAAERDALTAELAAAKGERAQIVEAYGQHSWDAIVKSAAFALSVAAERIASGAHLTSEGEA